MTDRIETREVLAACYLGPNKQNCRMLTHAVVVRPHFGDIEVLCGRVEFGSLADAGSLDEVGRNTPPTCAACLRAVKKRGWIYKFTVLPGAD